jgi:PAS domain S-box-containing protein
VRDRKRILIVEDSATQAERLQLMLEDRGHQTTIAHNGSEALARLSDFDPHLVISDIVMPVIDGYELCRRIKCDAGLRQIPVLLLTALSDPKDVLKGLESKADDFLVKPYKEEALLQRVNAALDDTAPRTGDEPGPGVDILFQGEHFTITASTRQVLNLLLSTYEAAVHRQSELVVAQRDLKQFSLQLEDKVAARTAKLQDELAERRRTEELLRRTEQMLQSITNGINDSITLIAADHRILWLNATALRRAGADRAEDVIGKFCYDVRRHPNEECKASTSICPIAAYLKTGTPAARTHTDFTADGKPYVCEVTAYPIHDDLGVPVSFISLSRDLTERLRFEQGLIEAAEKLTRLDQMKSEFISVASHELRTPMAAIKNAVDIILKKRAGDITEAQEKFLSMADRNVNRLTELVNSILDISRLESGKMELNLVKADVGGIVDRVIDTLAPLADGKAIAIERRIEEGLPQVYLDPSKIEQVLINLVGNAMKFTPAQGTIRIAVRVLRNPVGGVGTEERLEISVKDDGIGISTANVKHIFDKFFQVEGTLAGRQPGTGLGLAIARGLIEQHGGELKCASTEGEGTVFTMIIPIRSREDVFSSDLERELAKVLPQHERVTLLIIGVNECRFIQEACERDREKLMLAIMSAVTSVKLRPSDVVKLSSQTGEIVMILAGTGSKGGAIVRDKIIEKLPTVFATHCGDLVDLSYSCRMANYPLDARSARDLVETARPQRRQSDEHQSANPRRG